MKVSLSWLEEYVPIHLSVEELCDALTMAGLEVDSATDRYAFLETVVVGKIVQVLPHPNADRLTLCQVDAGGDLIQVVCGAPNVQVGQNVPLARIGTELPNGLVMEKTTIRGETSHGMLCSEIELALGDDGSGLMVLDEDMQPGRSLKQVLNLSDTTIEIDLTPNRPDCLSVIGVAREIAAIQGVAMKPPQWQLPETTGDIHALSSVTIQSPDHCPRYAARLLDQITVAPSPFWLQDRLRSVGIRPINNLVDVTNFVMMETGQPLHAFDFDQLAGHCIVVRTALDKEPFTTLDQKDRLLTDQMLMICDGEKPVAVGGVMGGLNSEIEETTTRVLVESAYFDPISIRKTSKALGLNTDASHRFERGVDPAGTLFALDRAVSLMAELGQGRLLAGTIDADHRTSQPLALTLSVDATNRLLGCDLSRDQMAGLLDRVDFSTRPEGDDLLTVDVPSFRVDVTRPRDLMEEVARLYGYNQIATTFPAQSAGGVTPLPMMILRNRIRDFLVGVGFSEAINYSFISSASCDRLDLDSEDARRQHVALLNPISEDQSVMRTTLIPGMLEAAQRNIARQQTDLRLFEVGKVFLHRSDSVLPIEKEMLICLVTGLRDATAWHTPDKPCDFFDAKGIVEALARALDTKNLSFSALPDDRCNCTRAGHTAQITREQQCVGIVGEIKEKVRARFNLKQPVFIVELDLEIIAEQVVDVRKMEPIPRFPSVSRDVTVIINENVESARLIDAVSQFDQNLVADLFLFDVFAGDPIPSGKKSVSFRVVYQSAAQTLEDDKVNTIHQRLIHRLLDEFDAQLPV